MICFLRRARRCFAVKGAGAGVLTAWCMAGAVFGVKGSGSVGCLTLANGIPFMTTLGCSEQRLWIQVIVTWTRLVLSANPTDSRPGESEPVQLPMRRALRSK